MADAPPTEAAAKLPGFQYTAEFPALLEALGVSLLVSTYQAGKVAVVRAESGRLNILLRTFNAAMGLAVDGTRLAIGTRSQVWFLVNAPDIAAQLQPAGKYDACYVPHRCHVTGDIRIHEIGLAGVELWVVNTRFSCLCTLHLDYSFVPRWRPPFVTALAPEDRCHLNGLALVSGHPFYVTALGETDTAAGWRPNKVNGGCIVDVTNGNILARGLCMPHSPRLHEHFWHRLWFLASGAGQLIVLDTANGKVETVAELPGFTRGLALCGRYAFVGLSKVRETAIFGGLPVAARLSDLQCGVWAIDTQTGRTVGHLVFPAGIEEIFDVQVLPGLRFPEMIGFEEDTIHGIFVVPPAEEGPASPAAARTAKVSV